MNKPLIKLSLIGDTAFCFNADGKIRFHAMKFTLLFLVCLEFADFFFKLFQIFLEDYMTIRTEYRIIGRLVGSTVKWPRNMSLNGISTTIRIY